MKQRVYLLLLFASLSAVEGGVQIEHTYLPQCICPPYSIDATVSLQVFALNPNPTYFLERVRADLSIGGKELNTSQVLPSTPNTGRIPLRIDPDLPYTTVTKIVNVPMGSDVGVWVQFPMPIAANIPVDARSAFSFNIPRFSDPEALVMEFPENSFPVDDITVWMSLWMGGFRTPGHASVETVPGDFCAIDKDGRKQGLISQIVFSLLFTDANNQTVTRAEGCKLRIRESVLLDISDTPSLYGLNKYTGFWEFNSNFVPLGNGILEASVQASPDVKEFNIGYKWDICVMKVAVDYGVEVSITQSFAGSGGWVFANTGFSDGELCLRVRCCKPTNPTCRHLPKMYGQIFAVLQGDIVYGPPTAENNGFSDELNAALEYSGGGFVSSITTVIEAYTGPIYPSIERCKAGNLYFQFSG